MHHLIPLSPVESTGTLALDLKVGKGRQMSLSLRRGARAAINRSLGGIVQYQEDQKESVRIRSQDAVALKHLSLYLSCYLTHFRVL